MSENRLSLRLALLILGSSLFTVACGGETGDGGTTPPVDYSQYQSELATLQSSWLTVPATDPLTLPLSGSATFTGVLQMAIETSAGELGVAGRLDLTSSFATNTIGGTATAFVDENAVALTGSLAITGGVLNRAANTAVEYTYGANLDGTLTGGGETFVLSGDLSGDFAGTNYLATTGIVAGTAVSSFGTGYMFGSFIAAQ